MDLEIIWDGSHRHADADLLCCPAVPVKVYAVGETPLRDDDALSDAAYDAVCVCLERGAYHIRELTATTGFSARLIVLAIERARRRRQLVKVPVPIAERGVGVPWMRYTLRREA